MTTKKSAKSYREIAKRLLDQQARWDKEDRIVRKSGERKKK